MTESLDKLKALVLLHVPENNGRIRLAPIVTGKFNDSYWVDTPERQLVLRIAPPDDQVFVFYERAMMRQEPELHQALRARTSVPVAEIIAFDDSRAHIDRDYMLMERLPGKPLTEMPNVNYDFVLRQVGSHLAQTHVITAEEYGYLGAHRPMAPRSRWVDAFQTMWYKLIEDIEHVGHYDAGEGLRMRRLLDSRLHLFDRDVPSSLLHMDVWHQNILVDAQGKVTGIVDWDRALWGDPEIEFAVLDYCGISEPAFWRGYGSDRDLSLEAKVRQQFYLLYELQKYIVIRQGRHDDSSGAKKYKAQVLALVDQGL